MKICDANLLFFLNATWYKDMSLPRGYLYVDTWITSCHHICCYVSFLTCGYCHLGSYKFLNYFIFKTKKNCHVMCHSGLKINKIIFYLATSAFKKERILQLNPTFFGGKIPSKLCVGKSYCLHMLCVNIFT